MDLLMFTKMLKNVGGLTLDEAGDHLVELGFDGADLTVRSGGYVPPEAAEERLPEAVDLLQGKGLSVPMITTRITGADDETARPIFETASACGVDYLKLGYWPYQEFGTIDDQLEAMQRDLDGIRDLSTEYAVTPTVHIHSGDYLSANPAVLRTLLDEYDDEHIGAYIDPGHMAIEGGGSGWEMGIDLLQRYVRIVGVKDFAWVSEETGTKTWTAESTPLSEGIVPWRRVFDRLDDVGFDGPLSVHSEYHTDTVDELVARTEADLSYLRAVLADTGYATGDE
jgi:sugar phosphate isomerase/epimerase